MPGINTDGMSNPPAGYAFTGNEQFPVDTELTAGAVPQTFAMLLGQLGFPVMVQSTPLTGFTITLVNPQNVVELTPAGTLAAGTIVFPNNAVNGQKVKIFSTQIVTALTLTPGNQIVGGVTTAQTINAAVTTLAANVAVEYTFQAVNGVAGGTWFRTQ